MSTKSEEKASDILLADPPTVDDIPESDPEGHVPAKVLINGGTTRIPRWPNYADQPDKADQLTVYWLQDGIKTPIYQETKDGPITEPEFLIPLGTDLFNKDGTAYLSYSARSIKPFPGNPVYSREKKLTIDRSIIPLPVLLEALFPDANLWGYLNCSTERPIWNGVYIKIPFQDFKEDDICEWVWRGFSVLNGADKFYIEGTRGEFSYSLTEANASNKEGFELPPIPFNPHLQPLIKECSGTVIYKIKRAGVYIGQSHIGLVKVDRTVPGSPPCGPP